MANQNPPPFTHFPAMLTMGITQVSRYIPGPNEICISIGDPGGEVDDLRLSPNFRAIRQFEFHDLANFTDAEIAAHPGAVDLCAHDADRMLDFVLAYRHARRLVIHCAVGASRSVSVAMALSTHFSGALYFPPHYTDAQMAARFIPNPRVFAVVQAACDRATAGPPAALPLSEEPSNG